MTLIEALTGPDGRARQPFNQVFTLHVRFAEGGIGRFPVVLLVNRIGDVGVEIEALIALFPHFLAQFQFRIGFTFVTETVFTLGTRCLETLLFAAASRPANTGTGVTVEIDSHCLSGHYARCDSNRQWEFAQSNHHSIS